jgi:serine/threonine protein phosphatase PrpC
VTPAEAPTTCPNCGEPLGEADQFCEACGHQIGISEGVVAAEEGVELGTQLITPPKATESLPAPERHCECGGVIDADGWCSSCGLRASNERDHITEQPADHVAAVSDRGQHHRRNEDAVALGVADDRTIIVVCDGVTNATDSDVASLAAANAARDLLVATPALASESPAERVEFWQAQPTAATDAAQAAATETVKAVGKVDNPPSCTYVAAVVDGPLLAVAWIGDSRAYWIGDDDIATQLSVDDSWATMEIARGVSREQAEADPQAHSITRWLGFDSPGGPPTFMSIPVAGPGWVLVCSDGLWNYCSEAPALRDLLRQQAAATDGTPLAIASALVDWANAQGGHDNITTALARAGDPRQGVPDGGMDR